MLAKINKLTAFQVAIILFVLGFAVYFSGLANQFQADDFTQITNAVPVHSITNIKLFFEGGTFYNGQGIAPLSGPYFRPLETIAYSLIYELFGLHVMAYHIVQLLLCIGCATLLYMVFRYSFSVLLALLLAIIFLIHPINSETVFAIPHMVDALFFFFGILAIWLLLRFKSVKSLWLVILCLFLSMLSKETAIVFIAMALLYLFWFNRDRLYWFIGFMVLPVTVYLILRINAIGLIVHTYSAPVDGLSISGRLLTSPSILLFYLTKFIFPWRLVSTYNWVYPAYSFQHVLLPLLIDLAVIGLTIYLAYVVHQKASKEQFFTYLFFAFWAFISLIPYLQIIPLDMTASETWFYLSMAGWLGMIGVILVTFQSRIRPDWLLAVAVILIILFGLRAGLRGLDWRNEYALASTDLAASKEDYGAYEDLANYYLNNGDYAQAKTDALRSIAIFPTYTSYDNLGLTLTYQGNYPGAINAYEKAISYDNNYLIYNNIAQLTLLYGSYNSNRQTLRSLLEKLPDDPVIWMYKALLQDSNGDNADAKISITNAVKYGQVPSFIYDNIMADNSFTILINGAKPINIP
ncbi:MAG TPA: tetratricopeptide repeat protein [Candidatus Saccharimonadales bacterium]|jgi:tetratricopeptide (TPR) repeat protein|nr:tetratricopeptide repeat protein [Candidatus Saccharimonadales bacterium]